MEFEFVRSPAFRSMAVVGDTLANVIGKPVGSSYPALVFNVTDQPSGSDIFSAGTDVAYATAFAAAFTHSGWHTFTVAGANGESMRLDVVCFPANALTVDRIKYQDTTRSAVRSAPEIRGSLRALAMQATKAGAEATLEGGAAVAPFYGAKPQSLGASSDNSLTPFGGW